MAKKPHRKRENALTNGALAHVAEATALVSAQHLASPWLRDSVALKFQWHTLFTRTIDAASSIARRSIWPDLFETYVILGSRWFSHHEAVETLLATGRYGDCMALLRRLLEDTDLMTYFAYYPEDAAEWRARLSRVPVWSDEVYRQGVQRFKCRSSAQPTDRSLSRQRLHYEGHRNLDPTSTTISQPSDTRTGRNRTAQTDSLAVHQPL